MDLPTGYPTVLRSDRAAPQDLIYLMLISSRAITAVWHFPLSLTRMVSQTLAREVQPSIPSRNSILVAGCCLRRGQNGRAMANPHRLTIATDLRRTFWPNCSNHSQP